MSRTILVTGATGYIAKHLVKQLLDAGHSVVGSVRRESRDAEMRAALGPALSDPAALERYRSVVLDLSSDDGWDAAMAGVDAVMHTASPFPLVQPKDPDELIRPAVDGALRALRAAHKAGITNVVFTSSTVAIREAAKTGVTVSEVDWSDTDNPAMTPYARSKTLAERAAWEFVEKDAPEMRLAVVNPSFVIGAPLDENYGTSIEVIERLYNGKDPMLPRIGFPSCHVEDVALAHIRALEVPEAAGNRHMIVDRFLWFSDLADAVRDAAPKARPARRIAPNFVIRLLSFVDPSIRAILPQLGERYDADNSRMREVLGIEPRSASEGAAEAARWLASRA
ncbi:MAG: NAD-dependent epimerase/dehydratase family protein [Pseudomonadota bacterium]